MRTIAELKEAIAARLKDYPVNKDPNFQLTAGELKLIVETVPASKAEKLAADDPVKEPLTTYAAVAAQHGSEIVLFTSSRKLSLILGSAATTAAPVVPPKP